MHALYQELITMTGEASPARFPEQAAAAIRTAAIPNTPDGFRRDMEAKTRHFIMPPVPDGQTFARGSFWSDFRAKFIWHKAWKGDALQKDNAAAWLKKQREDAQRRGTAWPPKPVFQKAVAQPAPWDGKNEKVPMC